ncbi:TonB-dependent hemoglobin/transferrin/lactoferrin family receptor [Chamaesiphon minutus]|uniref:TonB-dependent heme/hemoglobin receptor family protein/TonB-dependent hemoglobin/transferrin/lactoferrin receptor family protein n=1 Tax=Chamaesiphon minutus (strain ATCC 27169 / PCC 6605) TaxID=1173020 RepID=K9UFE4_CHAP6|nr:TonB-dependent hemoglobin/transferrin/lactoferrin family receptor [Chamaesiphon minutus]AFY93363.1 TonB-dependent heme/hemoglobin receptor family protein/TonB-dependent hemoglobin/transferrin/lactoferrin receptor family protein [Chamaesiphon minutus PCC 6605]
MKRYLLLGNSLWLLFGVPSGLSQTAIQPQLLPQLVSQVNIPNATVEPQADTELEITVIGTRTRRALKDSPSTVSVQDRQDLDRNFVRNLGDTIRYEPGVSVDNRPARAGNGSVNIRGIEGNRVLMLVDGIRLPDILGMTNTNRNLVDFDCIKRIEILRGSASSLYGSDALGGVVAYTTKDPEDYLQGRNISQQVKATYIGASRNLSQNIVLADKRGDISTSICYTRQDGRETSNLGNIAANPQTVTGNNLVGKVAYQLNPQNQLILTGELFDRRTLTTVNSSLGALPGAPGQTVNRTSQTADDNNTRGRVSLGYVYSNPTGSGVQKIRSNIYYQNANTTEESTELRTVSSAAGTSLRRRTPFNTFRQGIVGGDIQLETNLGGNDIRQKLVYGIEVNVTDTIRSRDNTEFNLTTATQTKNVGGEAFPNRTFPPTKTTRLGIYLQDEIELANGRLSIIPSVRYDYYNLNPNSNDADFRRVGVLSGRVDEVRELTASAISPKIGVVYKLSPETSITAQYARGFRSPPYDDAAISFTNFAQQYTAIPNANLKPETGDGFEIGLKTNGVSFKGSVVGFYNRYDNFIDTVQIGTASIGGQTLNQFQAQNIKGAEISGVEARGEYKFSPQPGGFSLLASAALIKGTNLETNQPLDSIDPFKAVLGLRYRSSDERWGTELVTTLVSAKDRNTTPTGFKTPGYTNFDLLSYYNFSPDTTLNLGLFNIFNTKYYQASDVRGVAANSSILDLYTQPGFSVAASLGIRF